MACEPAPNSFRASVLDGRRENLVVTDKKRRVDRAQEGLSGVGVPREEGRRANTRGGDRHRLRDEQAEVRFRGKRHVVELVNLSGGGAMIAGKLGAKLWDRVHLILGEHGRIECAVRWIRGDRLGLEFAHETQVECDTEVLDGMLRDVIRKSFPGLESPIVPPRADPETEAPEVEQKRSATRHPLIWTGVLHHQYEWEEVRLRNISVSGALIQCGLQCPDGAQVYLELAELDRVGATVSWSRGDQMGLAFDQPFDIRKLADCKPEVAPARWLKPDYLREDRSEQSPWAPEWRRLTIDDLSRSLGG